MASAPEPQVVDRAHAYKILDLLQGFVASLSSSFKTDYIGPNAKDSENSLLQSLTLELNRLFGSEDQYKQALHLRGSQAQQLINALQAILDTPLSIEALMRKNLVVTVQRISSATGLYPTCYHLENVDSNPNGPVAAGGFGDIYKGLYRGQSVCLKTIRVYQTSEADLMLKSFAKEAVLWAQLVHPNVTPFLGFTRLGIQPCFVSPWMKHGDINQYLNTHPSANRHLLIDDITQGLTYLHFYGIIHGDLKGANVLINSEGRACLADFGISSISDPAILRWFSQSTVASKGGSIRWQAPELFNPAGDEDVHNTEATDVYAWACVGYEVFTGRLPFYELSRDHTVMFKVTQEGLKPSKPPLDSTAWSEDGLDEEFWDLLMQCWVEDPATRPSLQEIAASLGPCKSLQGAQARGVASSARQTSGRVCSLSDLSQHLYDLKRALDGQRTDLSARHEIRERTELSETDDMGESDPYSDYDNALDGWWIPDGL